MKIQQPWEAKSIFKIILKKLKIKGGEKERKGKGKKGWRRPGEGREEQEVKSGYGRSQIAGDAAKGKLAFVGRKERGIIRAEVV